MEALSVLEGERERHRRWLEALGQRFQEVERNVLSPTAPSLAQHLHRGLVEGEDLFKEFEIQLSLAFETLATIAVLAHPSSTTLLSSQTNQIVEDPSDNLILAIILDHSANHPARTKIFLSENRKDFDNNPQAKLALEVSGVRYFADPSKFLEWHEANAES